MSSEPVFLRRINNRFILLSLLLLLSACSGPSLQSSGRGINSYPALWEAKSKQGKVYLFGSVHALSPAVKWYGKRIDQAFKASSELVLESVAGADDEALFRKIDRRYGLIDNGKVISDYLTPREYVQYKIIVKEINLNPQKADRMKPWLFSLIIGSVINQKPSEYGVDRLFYHAAKTKGMKISSVETAYQQMRALAAKPFNQQISDLKESLNTQKVSSKDIARQKAMMRAWMGGDTNRIARLLASNTSRAVYNSLIIKRNNSWYPKIKRYLLKKQTTMVVVGLAHLVGRGNIINKLKQDGYRIKRLQ